MVGGFETHQNDHNLDLNLVPTKEEIEEIPAIEARGVILTWGGVLKRLNRPSAEMSQEDISAVEGVKIPLSDLEWVILDLRKGSATNSKDPLTWVEKYI